MQRDDSFTVTASGGAGFAPESGVTLPAESTPDGAVRATGTIVLSAHDGALTVPLVNVVIDDDALWIADPAHEGTGEAPRIRLVTLHRSGVRPPLPLRLRRAAPPRLRGGWDRHRPGSAHGAGRRSRRLRVDPALRRARARHDGLRG